VAHDVRIRNQASRDEVFNEEALVLQRDADRRRGLFLQDDYIERGLGPETSRRSLVIFRTQEFSQAWAARNAYGYVKDLPARMRYVMPLTGALTGQD
jgi:hypothetical protein